MRVHSGIRKWLVFKAHRRLYHSTLGSRAIKKTLRLPKICNTCHLPWADETLLRPGRVLETPSPTRSTVHTIRVRRVSCYAHAPSLNQPNWCWLHMEQTPTLRKFNRHLHHASSRFESLILSHHSRFNVTCDYNKEEINDEMSPRKLLPGRQLIRPDIPPGGLQGYLAHKKCTPPPGPP